MAAIYQLLRDHEDVSLILSVCHATPQPAVVSGWQQPNPSYPGFSTPLATPQIWYPQMNLQQSILPASASLSSSTLSSPYPSLSFLMDFSQSPPASSRLRTLQNLQLSNVNTISESVSEPRISSTIQVFSSLLVSSSAPTLGVFPSPSDLVSPSSASSALDLPFSDNDSSLPILPPFQDLGTFAASDGYPPYFLDAESSITNSEPGSSSASIITTAFQDDISKTLIEPQKVSIASPSTSSLLYSPEMDISGQQEEASAAPSTHALASQVTSNIDLGPHPTPYAGIITALPEDSLSKLLSRQDSSSTSPSLFSPDLTSLSPTTVLDPAFIPILIDTQDIMNSRPATPSITTILGNANRNPSIFSNNLHLPAQLSSPLSSPTPHLHISTSLIPASPHSPVSRYTDRLRNSSTFLRDTTTSTSQYTMHQRASSATFSPNLPSSQSPNKRKHAVVLDKQTSELSPSHAIITTRSQRAKKLSIGLGLGLDTTYHTRKKVKTSTGDKENQMTPDEGMNL